MSIAEFIRDDILGDRLKKAECLVVYDPNHRYHDLCLDLTSDDIQVIDTSESSIESREQAQTAFAHLSRSALKGMVVYIPTHAPRTDEQKQADPFSIYALCGAQFPADDGDDYLNLCLRAKPEHSTEIRRIFNDNPAPPFDAINAIGGGIHWPQLRATLKADSAEDILMALMAPSSAQTDSLKTQEGWHPEAKDFLKAALGLKLKTRAKTWKPIADELWRFILFSEFVFDLPVPLPSTIQDVPAAPAEAKSLICALCERLRNDKRYQDPYIKRAETVEQEMNLDTACRQIEDLGELDTFPFEERTFLQQAIKGLETNDLDKTRQLLSRHTRSIWHSKGENQEQWALLQSAMNLIVTCQDCDRLLPEYRASQEHLISFYIEKLREADSRQREFAASLGAAISPYDLLEDAIAIAHSHYRRLIEKVQTLFTQQLEKEGWPAPDRISNASVFDRFVAPRLSQKGQRVAYLLIDALRYELGVELEKLLTEVGSVELYPACAQLPSITLVGMASLLPNAENDLVLTVEDGRLIPKLGEVTVGNVSQRMGVLRKELGDRFTEMPLRDFVKKKKPKVEPTVDLLVLRSTEIDSQLESNPEDTLSLIPKTLRDIRVALSKLSQIGFQDAIIVSDHGFFLNTHAEAGDVCTKPPGDWLHNAHDRMLLGKGSEDAHNCVFSADKLGIRGSFGQVALPKTMAPYRAGHLYFHGGISLAEAIVPVILVRLDAVQPEDTHKFQLDLTYKRNAKKITTRLPRIDIELTTQGNLFTSTESCEILLEARDSSDNVIGEPRPSEDINPATGTITLIAGEQKSIMLRMDPSYEGKFTIKALEPTTLTTYASLPLQTDYTV
ncbi:PglZ domain-containing protein [Leptolyngbya sp. BC1307]|uniref:PglZ domain-containing protein n=1 Tax=Leptolyngbya sp. BC1307 TaxID=2029589 RepID=UPI000EFAEAE4|nr:PglZ domain-containing protein [Leptolyngbya sp. BC1307]